jgi:hypothetical protein
MRDKVDDGGPARERTLRDEFAARALMGLLACPDTHGESTYFAELAYDFADAMLAARKGARDE